MGDDISLSLSFMAVCFDFCSTNIVHLSNWNAYFYQFRCHHPLITQLWLVSSCQEYKNILSNSGRVIFTTIIEQNQILNLLSIQIFPIWILLSLSGAIRAIPNSWIVEATLTSKPVITPAEQIQVRLKLIGNVLDVPSTNVLQEL